MLFEMHALNVHFCRRLPVVLCVVIFLIHYLWIAKLNHHCLKFVFRTPDMLLNSDPTSFFLFLGTVILFWRSWKSPCCTEAGAHSISGKASNTERVLKILVHYCSADMVFWCTNPLSIHIFIFLLFLHPGTDPRIWSPCFFWFRKSVPLPLKWFAVGQCWRYERMTRGRRREHYQWNMDIIGVPEVTVSAVNFILFFELFSFFLTPHS